MRSAIRVKKQPGAGKSLLPGLLAACCLGLTASANAVVEDDPYFQLFPGAPYDFDLETSPGDAVGDDTSVSICGAANGVSCTAEITVEVANENPSGTGYIYSFLRLNEPNNDGQDADSTGLTTESGYNTNFPTLQEDSIFDNDSQDSPGAGNDWNRAVLISDLQEVDGFYQIILDLDEQGNNPGEYIRLDEFEIHTSSDGLVRDYNPNDPGEGSFGAGADADIVFDMDVWKDYPTPAGTLDEDAGFGGLVLKTCDGEAPATGGKCGSGTYDYVFNIPVELLAGGEWMHIVATLGAGSYTDGDWNPEAFAGAGFDEFAAVLCEEDCGDGEVPVPGTAFLLGLGLLGIFGRRRIVT